MGCCGFPKNLLGIHPKGLKAACRIMDFQNSQLEADAKEVLIGSLKTANGGVSADGLGQVMGHITDWNKSAVNLIQLCKQEIIGYKGSSSKKNQEIESRFSQLADEYVNNSEEMLEFLVELDRFLKSASFYHDQTAKVVQADFNDGNGEQYKRIFENLRNLRDGHTGSEQCAEKLLEKVHSLMDKQKNFLLDSKIPKKKLFRKQQKIGRWRKMFTLLVVGSVAAILVCAIVMTVVASPAVIAIVAAIVACIDPGIKGFEWITSWLKDLENDLKKQERAAELMHDNTRAVLKELGEIKYNIRLLINQIEAILLNPESPFDKRDLEVAKNDIKNKLGPLHTMIKNLEDKASKCSDEITEGRNEVIQAASGLARAKNYL